MRFDSHVLALLEAVVGLVNGLTPGAAQGALRESPSAAERTVVLREVLTTPSGVPRITHDDAARLTTIAHRLRFVFKAVEEDDIDAAARAVNHLLRDFGARPQLDHAPADGWNVHFHGSDDSLVVGWTAGCAAALALALGSDLAGRLGTCDAERCDRDYVDTSRNGTRRFCSTACQSRKKAAAFRERQRASGS
jgi:hypothetical protein